VIKLSNTLDIIQSGLELNNNNINQENTFIRDMFLASVHDYFVHLVTTNEKIIENIKTYNSTDSETLNALINQLIMEMESGLVDELDEQLYENMLIVLTTAIKNKPKKLVRKYISTNKHIEQRFDKFKKVCYN